jgi:deoxyadenosine/deoxycytidine kinase
MASFSKKINLSVEGNIGSGKTSVVEFLRDRGYVGRGDNRLDILALVEPVKRWKKYHGYNLLEMQYRAPLENSVRFQLRAMHTFHDNHIKMHRSLCPLNVMERSMHTAFNCFLRPMKKM